jgi:hypothetical protein
MANDTSTGYASNWNVENVNGDILITFSPTDYPFLSRLAGVKQAASHEFAMSAQYALAGFSAAGVPEDTSVTAPTAVAYGRTNETNYTQTQHKSISVTYDKLASNNRLVFTEVGTSGFAYTGDPLQNAINDELAFQVSRVKEQLYGNLETAFMTGTKTQSTAGSVAWATGGIETLVSTNKVNASSAQLSKTLIDNLLRTMFSAGAKFRRMVFFANAWQRYKLSEIYSYVPPDRTMGGGTVGQVQTDFGLIDIVPTKFATSTILSLVDMSYCYLVKQPVPGKGYMPDGLYFMEELAKTGAAEKYQIFGNNGLDIGAEKLHGQIYGLATS